MTTSKLPCDELTSPRQSQRVVHEQTGAPLHIVQLDQRLTACVYDTPEYRQLFKQLEKAEMDHLRVQRPQATMTQIRRVVRMQMRTRQSKRNRGIAEETPGVDMSNHKVYGRQHKPRSSKF